MKIIFVVTQMKYDDDIRPEPVKAFNSIWGANLWINIQVMNGKKSTEFDIHEVELLT